MAIPLVLCGGAGTRLWPLSRAQHPKPFLRLLGKYTFFQQTLLRLKTLGAPLILCHANHYNLARKQCQEIDVSPRAFLLEPSAQGTAAAVIAAHLYLKSTFDVDALLISPADLIIQNQDAFLSDIKNALPYAKRQKYVTFGSRPTRVEPRFGHIEVDQKIQSDVFTITHFAGKLSETILMRNAQKYFWNSGIFIAPSAQLDTNLYSLQPELTQICSAALQQATQIHQNGTPAILLDFPTYATAPKSTFEEAIKSTFAGNIMVRAHFDWNDAGTWNALWQLQASAPNDNVSEGNVRVHDAQRCYLRATSKRVSVVGCQDIIVVETEGEILVTTRAAAEKVSIFADDE